MSRRAANFTQADVARALRAAQQVGGDWEIVIEGKAIRITPRATIKGDSDKLIVPAVQEEESGQEWSF
jgi:hypothetical protein